MKHTVVSLSTRIFVFPAKKSIAQSVYGPFSGKTSREAHEIFFDCGFEPRWLAKHKAHVRQTHRRVNCAVVEAPEASLKRLSEDLKKKGHRIAGVKPVYLFLHESVALMEALPLWQQGLTGKGIKVAVVDSGVDANHPDLAGRIVAAKDFTGKGLADRVGHGTHVAGIIAGAGAYYRGVAPDASLIAAKVLDKEGTTDDVVLAGISWAAYSGAQVINLSLGGPGSPDDVLSQECDALMKEGIVICVAAGNSGPIERTIGSPGTSRLSITVGAVDKDGKITLYSSRGPVKDPKTKKDFIKPDLLACGGGYAHVIGCDYRAGIISAKSSITKPGECSVVLPSPVIVSLNSHSTALYEKMSGTSMATPHVSGICALLLQSLSQSPKPPNSSIALALKETLIKSAKSLGLKPSEQGAGLLSASRALKRTPKNFTVPPSSHSPLGIRPWGASQVLREGPGYKAKILTINPKSRTSLQFHRHRSETWIVLEGETCVILGESIQKLKTVNLKIGQTLRIPSRFIHRIENATSKILLIFEVQWGKILREDDITRLQDDYGRDTVCL
ncbi:MAG: S8 family serine peptidase [Elusimicrobiota bacterium]